MAHSSEMTLVSVQENVDVVFVRSIRSCKSFVRLVMPSHEVLVLENAMKGDIAYALDHELKVWNAMLLSGSISALPILEKLLSESRATRDFKCCNGLAFRDRRICP